MRSLIDWMVWHVVGDDEHGLAGLPELLHPLQALALEGGSPTARTSSISRMSGSTSTATANPSRTYMPEE